MKLLRIVISIIGFYVAQVTAERNLVCYYDSASYVREGFAKLLSSDLELALQFCTHLIYGYAGLNPRSFELTSLNVDLDMFHYTEITSLKLKYPQLKVYLSVGGDKDYDAEHPQKYIDLLETTRETQQNFIDSSVALLRSNSFDGLDLAFQLPRNKPRKVHGTVGTYWKQFKKLFTGNFIVDTNAESHKRQFTELAKNLKRAFSVSNLNLTLTVLPNVNSTWYFDVPELVPIFEYVNLAAFDFLTPERNPEEADYTAPLYLMDEQNRLPHYNVDSQVKYWIDQFWPRSKINVGIASYGRAWKMSTGSGLTGMPVVVETIGAADPGLQSHVPGLLSWPEICSKLSSPINNTNFRGPNAPIRKVMDLTRLYGNYALRPADDSGEHGLWVSYDDPEFAAIKGTYVREQGLGGVALFDLGFDDFRGLCSGQKYPILRMIKSVI